MTSDENTLIDQWLKIGRANPWIKNAYDPPFNRDSFCRCDTVDELREKLGDAMWCLGQAFYLEDLCLINQDDGGDEWLTIRHGFAFESFTFGGFIERGEFNSVIERLLRASKSQCRNLDY